MFFLWRRISEVTKRCRLRNDLYCVEWGVKLYSSQPTTKRWLAAAAWWRRRRPLAVYCMHSGNITDIWSGSNNRFEYLYTFFASPIRSHWHDVIFKPKVCKVSGLGWIKLVFVEINGSLYLMRTNILQNSLYTLKSRISKDCTVEMLICRLTNYELLRWLVETPSRDFAHYRLSGGHRIFTTCQELTSWHVDIMSRA